MAKRQVEQSSFAFFDFLRQFYTQNKGRIRNRYKDLTKKFLDYNDSTKNPRAYLRTPQFEALETYVFLKEFCNNPQIYDLFDKWYKRQGDFAAERQEMIETQDLDRKDQARQYGCQFRKSRLKVRFRG